MGRKQKPQESDPYSISELYHRDTLPYAILTALIDPQEVRDCELTNTWPKAFFTAMHLLGKIDDWITNRAEKEFSPEDLRQIFEPWPLFNGTRFTLEEALHQDWCKYESLPALVNLLKRNGYPFDRFGHVRIPVFITKEAYQMALEDERKRVRVKERERKRATKEKLRKTSPGIKARTSGIKRQTSGTKARTSGTSNTPPKATI